MIIVLQAWSTRNDKIYLLAQLLSNHLNESVTKINDLVSMTVYE